MKKSVLILTLAAMLSGQVMAQTQKSIVVQDTTEEKKDFRNAINACPLGIPFGIFVVNYERLIKPNHGLVARFDYEMIPKTYSDANIESNGYAFTLNYRYHFKGEMNSLFAGVYGRTQLYTGNGTLESGDFDFDIYDFTLGVNVGKRWVWNNGLNVTFSLGYGYDYKVRNSSISSSEVNNAIDAFEDGYDFMNPFMGELSIGYAF